MVCSRGTSSLRARADQATERAAAADRVTSPAPACLHARAWHGGFGGGRRSAAQTKVALSPLAARLEAPSVRPLLEQLARGPSTTALAAAEEATPVDSAPGRDP